MKIIKLTLSFDKRIVFVNIEKIIEFLQTKDKSETVISFSEKHYFNVVETPEEILERIENACMQNDCIEINEEMNFRFVGQKDKNGNEVREGDVVKVGGLVEVVKYIDGILCCFSPEIYGKINSINIDNEDHQNAIVTDSKYFEPYEIIGNINYNS